jgi:hypothetical protein
MIRVVDLDMIVLGAWVVFLFPFANFGLDEQRGHDGSDQK